MFGLDAISHYNGWAMAFAGASIVLSGLAVLSFIISQLHRIVGMIDKQEKESVSELYEPSAPITTQPAIQAPEQCPADLGAAAELYQPLISELGEPFQLADLYALANRYQFPHPHITIRCFREAAKLEPMGNGQFRWNQ